MASAMGATVEFHYCMGHNMGATFAHNSDDLCRKCGMHKSKSKGCCHDEHKIIKTAEHHAAKANLESAHFIAIAPPHIDHFAQQPVVYSSTTTLPFSAHAPPDELLNCAIYILFRNLRI
jgi:hypothetical protein